MYERILVATGFDERSERAAAHAMELAAATGAAATILHVIEQIGDSDDEDLSDFYDKLTEPARERMEALAEQFVAADVRCTVDVRVGRRWKTILQVADEIEADLVILGSRPTVSMEVPHLGSTSHQVFFASRRDLLVLRS